MAKYKGLVEFSGTIGDLVFYNLNGTPVVRRKSGFSKEAYQSHPNYQKVRENSSEFGHCSKVGKMIRLALEPHLGNYEDKYLYQKFAKVMTQIKDLDTLQPKGKRRVNNGLKHTEAYTLLQSFKFGKYAVLENIKFESSFFSNRIQLPTKHSFNEVELLTLNPNFEQYTTEIDHQKINIDPKRNHYEFDVHFQDSENPILYFLILKSQNEITQAGFIS